jgi:hypothetical protein
MEEPRVIRIQIMGWKKALVGLIIGIAGGSGLGFFGFGSALTYFKYHNVSYQTPDKRTTTRMDGVTSHIEYEEDRNGVARISKSSFTYMRVYTDEDKDGLVDTILDTNPSFSDAPVIMLDRKKHFDRYAKVFREADTYFQRQKERLKPYLPKWQE